MTFADIERLHVGVEKPTPDEVAKLIYEVWNLRIIVSVLRVTLNCWRAMYGCNAKSHDWLISQDRAAVEVLAQIDDE